MKHRPPIRESLFQDELGTVDIMAYVALITLVAIGMITGLATLRDRIAQEYTDLGWALMSLDQSYKYTAPGQNGPVTVTHGTPGAGHTGGVPNGLSDTSDGQAPHGMNLTIAGGNEAALVPSTTTVTITRPGHNTPGLPAQPAGGSETDPLP